MPTMPFTEEGNRMEPPVSVPSAPSLVAARRDVGVQLLVHDGDALEHGLGQLDGGQRPALEEPRRLADGEVLQLGPRHGKPPNVPGTARSARSPGARRAPASGSARWPRPPGPRASARAARAAR